MGTVYKKQTTRPLPVGAEVFTKSGQRYARWKPKKGKTRTAKVTTGQDGSERIVTESATYVANYRDGEGFVQTVPTGCRDEDAARSVLGELERRSELVKARVLTPEQDNVANQQDVPFAEHVEAFVNRRTKRAPNGVTLVGQNNSRARLTRLASECGFRVLSDLRSKVLDRWMRDRLADAMSPANINEFRNELVIFANWCIRTKRLLVNPVNDVPKLDATANLGRKRRSMTEAELVKLLRVARWRPLAEFGRLRAKEQAEDGSAALDVTESKSKRRKWTYSPLTLDGLEAAVERARERLKGNPQFIAKQERLGRERALIFKTLVLTGLRKGELASVTVGQLDLDTNFALVTLNAADEKNRKGNSLPIRADLADDLRTWLATLQSERQGASDADGERIALTFQRDAGDALPLDTPLFTVPAGLVRILDRDLDAAGIPKRDERGWTIDVHALRHSFGTLLSKGGVTPRTAQAAMRHSDISLTMTTYTDPKLLDVQGALDALPSLPLGSHPNGKENQRAQATGTEGASNWRPDLVAVTVAVATDFPSHSGSFPVVASGKPNQRTTRQANDENPAKPNEKASFAGFANKAFSVERKGVEPSTSALRTQRSPN